MLTIHDDEDSSIVSTTYEDLNEVISPKVMRDERLMEVQKG